ncbi:D123-domain-containing protein [Xylariaceae sp. FL0804]|nr:D123-domain-containing protein [Xylariaceae sp. FL0804]
MPSLDAPQTAPLAAATPAAEFPPITRDHILNCSYDSWFPRYRTACIKSRIIPLSPEFIEYIREDGIILADDDGDDDGAEPADDEWESAPSTFRPPPEELSSDSDSDSESEEDAAPRPPPNRRFPELHRLIGERIAELGGEVAPKLNWTAPKDAAWISPHQNTVKCTCPNDVYLLLKSSNFVTYDLEHAFDDCTPPPQQQQSSSSSSSTLLPFRPVLVLRAYFNPHTALEFRCFVKHRVLVAVSQRDLRHFDFLRPLRAAVVARVARLFDRRLRYTFPDGCFAFDVYLPEGEDDDSGDGAPLGRARLIDINPWAPHTDSLLYDWRELLAMPVPGPRLGVVGGGAGGGSSGDDYESSGQEEEEDTDEEEEGEEEEELVPELRLVEKEDPAAFNLGSPPYSAHKLPRDVVDASLAGEGGMRDFARKWREMTEYRGDLARREPDVGGGAGCQT